jgi:hypothetical protein
MPVFAEPAFPNPALPNHALPNHALPNHALPNHALPNPRSWTCPGPAPASLLPDPRSRRPTLTRRFALTFDYLCPFARNANEHAIEALRAGADLAVTWTPYSLAQGHVEDGQPSVWDRDEPHRASGLLALQAGLVVRDEHPERFLDVHEQLFAARHDRGEDLRDRDVVAKVLEHADVDADAVFARIDDGSALAALRREHENAVEEHQVWGVPTFITEERAVFVRVLDRPEGDGDRATERVAQVLDLVRTPLELHEFKQVDLPR